MTKITGQKGFVLLSAILILALLLLLSIYVISFTLTEMKIASSQSLSAKTYYLAESGIAEAIWKIKNDATWKANFENDPNWSVTYSRNPALYSNGWYTVTIQNTAGARGEITATGYVQIGQNIGHRVIKTIVYKALGTSVIGDNGEYADGNIDLSGSMLHVYNGSVFSNNNIIVNFWSTLNVDGEARAVGNINLLWNSIINATAYHSNNLNPPAPSPIAMPAVSFDDAGDPDSYKNRADHIYTPSQFDDLLYANRGGTLTLDGITYVTGDINIKGPNSLIINGVLVSERDITLGKNTLLCCWGFSCGRSDIAVNQSAPTEPSGILAKRKINFELCLNNFNATGLIYANDQISMLSFTNAFNVTGGVASRKLTLTSIWQGANIIYDNNIITYALGNPLFSPLVTVEHWEEEY